MRQPYPSAALTPAIDHGVLGHDERAYALLEEARLRCEALIARAIVTGCPPGLVRACGELGSAGYFASSAIEPERRCALLAGVRERCDSERCDGRSPGRSDAHRALAQITEAAEDAVSDGLSTPHLADHMHLAHVHLLYAQELLARVPDRTDAERMFG